MEEPGRRGMGSEVRLLPELFGTFTRVAWHSLKT